MRIRLTRSFVEVSSSFDTRGRGFHSDEGRTPRELGRFERNREPFHPSIVDHAE